jgi:hypothetical protein
MMKARSTETTVAVLSGLTSNWMITPWIDSPKECRQKPDNSEILRHCQQNAEIRSLAAIKTWPLHFAIRLTNNRNYCYSVKVNSVLQL